MEPQRVSFMAGHPNVAGIECNGNPIPCPFPLPTSARGLYLHAYARARFRYHCSRSTAPGEAGIAIVRISGPQSLSIADRVFRHPSERASQLEGGRFLYGRVAAGTVRR